MTRTEINLQSMVDRGGFVTIFLNFIAADGEGITGRVDVTVWD